MFDRSVSRREVLRGSGAVLVGTIAWSSGPIALLSPSRTWAVDMANLTRHEGQVLLRLTRNIYPHDTLEDAVYALVVKDLDGSASDLALHQLLSNGVTQLDARANGDWLGAEEEIQSMHVRAIAGNAFFEKVRSTAVVSLYNNDMAWAHFGYEGPAFSKGGYISRGFNDLRWLPDPPAEASPPLA